MARSITLTLGAGLGADLGPNFNLTADVGSVTPSTATKSELLAGKSVSVDDLATQVTVTSTGTCTNAITQTIPCAGGTTTTTTTAAPTTTTTTTTAGAVVEIYVTNASLDVPITDITINGVSITWISGGDGFPLPAGENGYFTSSQIGLADIIVYYGGHTSGQNILILDSESASHCCNLNGSTGTCTFVSATTNTTTAVYITASDGTCL
jgi:hypothetical protein